MALPAPDAPILLVDDDPEMRAMLRDVLAGACFRTEEAADAEALLALVPRVEPAAIILDHEMPGDWGLEVLPTLRQRWPQVPVIIITAFGGPQAREAATRLGAAAYLDKPFRLDSFLEVLCRALSPAMREWALREARSATNGIERRAQDPRAADDSARGTSRGGD